jgi:hypothetical protein
VSTIPIDRQIEIRTNTRPDQIAAALEAFFWPKIFWDFLTKNLDSAVKPFPILQIINLVLGIVGLAWEWPLPLLAGTGLHRSIEARLIMYPLSALCALLIYQGTNSGLYYIIGMMAYFWAYSEGEVSSSRDLKSQHRMLTRYLRSFALSHGLCRSEARQYESWQHRLPDASSSFTLSLARRLYVRRVQADHVHISRSAKTSLSHVPAFIALLQCLLS